MTNKKDVCQCIYNFDIFKNDQISLQTLSDRSRKLNSVDKNKYIIYLRSGVQTSVTKKKSAQ